VREDQTERADRDAVLILRPFESQPQPTARPTLKNSSSAAISDQLEQQLLADPELTTDQAMTLASAFRAMHASMKRPGRDKA
jgi:hypothetical protein